MEPGVPRRLLGRVDLGATDAAAHVAIAEVAGHDARLDRAHRVALEDRAYRRVVDVRRDLAVVAALVVVTVAVDDKRVEEAAPLGFASGVGQEGASLAIGCDLCLRGSHQTVR